MNLQRSRHNRFSSLFYAEDPLHIPRRQVVIVDTPTIFAFVQTLAVVAGLVFVGLQIRDARRVTQGATYHTWVETFLSFSSQLATEPDLATLFWRGRTSPRHLSEPETAQFLHLCMTHFTIFENLFLQSEQKLIPHAIFRHWRDAFASGLQGEGFERYWKLERTHYADNFSDFVAQQLELQRTQGAPSQLEAFRSTLQLE